MKPKKNYTFETFTRNGIIYVRFINTDTKAVIATRSTKATTKAAASATVARLLRTLDLEAMEAAKAERRTESDRVEDALSSKTVAEYIRYFWSDEGKYVKDRERAQKALSGAYLYNNRLYSKTHIETYPPFQATKIGELTFRKVDHFFRELAEKGESAHVIGKALDALRRPITWGAARGLCEKIDFKGLTLPRADRHERGILTDAEIKKILALPVQPVWTAEDSKTVHLDVKPRPRLSGGRKNEGPPLIDVRQKAYVLLGLFAGLRRGEERALTWAAVDLEAGEIDVKLNYQNADGLKAPKADSRGRVPIAPELDLIFWELKSAADALGLNKPSDFVLLNPSNPERPVSETALRRGWVRVLELIGISDAERRARHLVHHGARHRFATKLLDSGMTPAEAGKLTRQRTSRIVERYADHLTEETRKKAIAALRIKEGKDA